MCGGGSGGQLKPITTSTTTADPRAQAMYQQAFSTAQQAAQTPFMRYSTDPRAFVAQLTPTQQQAISNIAQSQGVYQPYYGAAAGLAGGAGTTSTADIVGQYMSPYMSQVVDPVRAALQQQQGMQLSQQQAEAIKGGAFGGERAALQRAALRGQQQLGLGQALSPLYQTGYGQALGAAQGDLARQLQAGQVMGGLGTGAQQAAMQGAQGLLGAGTLQQQTQQAGLQALYNQFLMERGYPFQTSQFLTSAAAGLGPLYGGTTVEQQATNPYGMFLSDPRAKTGVDRDEPDVVGKLNDGQNVYAYRYANGGPAQIGLMADEVAQRYPDAVGQRPDGLMTVDYGKATEVPAAMSHGLGAARMGGAVTDGGDYARGGYAIGGHLSYVDPNDPGASDRRRMDALLASHKGEIDTFVPTKMNIPTGAVQASQGLQPARTSGSRQAQSEGVAGLLGKGAGMAEAAQKLTKTYDFFKDKMSKAGGGPASIDIPSGPIQASRGLQPAQMSRREQEQQASLYDMLTRGAKMGESAEKLYKAYDFFKDRFSGPSNEAPSAETQANAAAAKGIYAYGGVPTSMDIPDEAIRASRGLEPARISGSGREEEDDGILGALGKVADIGSKAATIGSLAMKAAPFVMSLSDPRAKTGVRHGYADRGAVPTEDDVFERGLLGAESAHRQFDKEGRTLTSPKGALGIAQIMPGTAPEAARLAGLEYDPIRLRQDPEYNKALGKAYFDEQRRRFGSDELAAAAYNAGPGRVQQALRQAEATGRDVMSFLPAETRAYVPKVMGRGDAEGQPLAYTSTDRPSGEGGLGAINRVADRGSLRAEAPPPAEAGLGAARTPGEEPGFMDKYMKEEYVVPGLIGLAGAVEGALSAPTTSLGAALARGAATGVGAGAKAYEDIQTALPARRKTEAEAAERQAQAGETKARELKTIADIPTTAMIVDSQGRALGVRVYAPGSSFPTQVSIDEYYAAQERGRPYLLAPAGGEAPGTTPPSGGASQIGATAGAAQPERESSVSTVAEPVKAPTAPLAYSNLSKEEMDLAKRWKSEENKMANTALGQYKDIYTPQQERAEAARDARNQFLPMAAALASLPKKGKLAPGPLQEVMFPIISKVNDIANRLNFEKPFDASVVANVEEANKYLSQLRTKAAAAGDQRAVSALEAIARGYPSNINSSEGLAKLLAGMAIESRKEIDKHEFFQKFRQIAGGQRAPMASASWANLDTIYDKDRQKTYQKDREALERLFYEQPQNREKLFIDQEGRPTKDPNKGTTWAAWIIKNAGSITPDQVRQIEKQFNAPGILRYLGV